MVLNKFAEKTEENTSCSIQFLYSLMLCHLITWKPLNWFWWNFIFEIFAQREMWRNGHSMHIVLIHCNFKLKNEGTKIMQLNMFYWTLLVFDWYINMKTLPVVLPTLNASDLGSVQMWYVMNYLATRVFLVLHNLPATLTICIVA